MTVVDGPYRRQQFRGEFPFEDVAGRPSAGRRRLLVGLIAQGFLERFNLAAQAALLEDERQDVSEDTSPDNSKGGVEVTSVLHFKETPSN